MATNNTPFRCKLEAINLYKFGSLLNQTGAVDLKNSINLLTQTMEVNLYQNIFEPIMKADLVIKDYIGLFVNFPITGEEVVEIIMSDITTNERYTHYYVISEITDIMVGDNARVMNYIIHLHSIEAYANVRRKVSHAYHGKISDFVKELFEEYIAGPTKKFYPSYKSPPFTQEVDNATQDRTIVIPNLNPLNAISWLASLATSSIAQNASWIFYQTPTRFRFTTIESKMQELEDLSGAREGSATKNSILENKYKYVSDEIEGSKSQAEDGGRYVTNLIYNKRHSNLDKIARGYFQNAYYEINLFQKSFNVTKTSRTDDELKTISKFPLSTDTYKEFTPFREDNDEYSNYTKYVFSNVKDNDTQFPVPEMRDRWGRNVAATVAMSQIDLLATIPGDFKVVCGEIMYLEVPEVHGFNDMKADDLISGYFLISEVKHCIGIGGQHATVMRLNKDSYNTTVTRDSRYANA